MHRWNFIIAAVALALLGACAGPATTSSSLPSPPPGTDHPAPDASDSTAPPDNAPPRKVAEVEGVTEYALDNGLRVLLFPDPSQAQFMINVTYFVGSRHEGPGEAGMAHLLEHMLFKGTPTHPDLIKLLEQRGAGFNGGTGADDTSYYALLPASDDNLAFALALEADRMINSNITAEDLATERSVVHNELDRMENNPARMLAERIHTAAYLWHGYGRPTIGTRSDIEHVPLDRLRRFYERYYQPDNAVLALTGRFDPDRALALVHEHFGPIPRPTRSLAPTYTVEPVQDGERQVILRRAGELGFVSVLYHGVPGAHHDFMATNALVHLLTDEPSGRLYRALVQTGLATAVWGHASPQAEPGTIQLFAEVPAGKPLEPVRDRMLQIIEGLGAATGTQAITEQELARFRVRNVNQFELDMLRSEMLARVLGYYAGVGDWRLLFLSRDRAAALTLEHVREVAGKYLKRTNRTLGMFIPTKEPDLAPRPELPDVAALVRDYQGRGAPAMGEDFEATVDSVEARTRRTRIGGGLEVAFLPRRTRGGVVHMLVTLRYGSEQELRGRRAAASLLPHMLMRGTHGRSQQDIRDELDRLKAQVDFSGPDALRGAPGSVTARVSTTRDNLLEVVALLAELLRQPALRASELEIVRNDQIALLEDMQGDPTKLAQNQLFRAMSPWPPGDVRQVSSIAGQIAALRRVNLQEVRDLHRRLWGATAGEITVLGDFHPEELEAALVQHLGDWKPQRPYQRVATPHRPSQPGSALIRTPDKANAFVGVGHAVDIRDDDPDYPALAMASYILFSSGTSRLIDRLREKEGISYAAFGDIIAGPLDRNGKLFAGALCAPRDADRALAFMIEEIHLLRDEGVSDDELAGARESYLQRFTRRLASSDALLSMLHGNLHAGRTLAFQKALNERIEALTPADIQRVLETYLQPEQLFQVRAGDL